MDLNTSARPADELHTSESEEMYLIHIAMAAEDGNDGPIPVRLLAESLAVSPVSANQMIKKLEGRNLVHYAPYRGVDLTEIGRVIARRVLRRRRLWAVFLSDLLGFSPGEADSIACDLEHVTSSEVADRLAAMLGDPAIGPGGRPIPTSDGSAALATTTLADIGVGQPARVLDTADIAGFLDEQAMGRGTRVTVAAVGSNGSILVETPAGKVHLSGALARTVTVEPT